MPAQARPHLNRRARGLRRIARISRGAICRLCGSDDERISHYVEYDPGCAIGFTFHWPRPSGSAGDPGVFGSQQNAPLRDVDVPRS